jgi:transcriptional regulator of acetoin/glycerol metabolism
MIMTPGDIVRADDLPADIRAGDAAPRLAAADGAAALTEDGTGQGSGTLREFKDASERAYLVAKLRETSWNISKTAEIIDTPRSNLYKKLEQHGIKQEVDG